MIICGIKLTHDGAVALIDNGRLVFCYELEKLNNRKRHALLDNFNLVTAILEKHGYKAGMVDRYVIDGWDDYGEFEAADPVPYGWIVYAGEQPVKFILSRYGHQVSATEAVLAPAVFTQEDISLTYHSYLHVAGHLTSAYCTSPFAAARQDAYCLVWDGGMYPQLFFYNAGADGMTNLGAVAALNGNVYSLFAQQFSPFKEQARNVYDLSIAGKVMAYVGLGSVHWDLLEGFRQVFRAEDRSWSSVELVQALMTVIADFPEMEGADAIATFDRFLELELLEGLRVLVAAHGQAAALCYAGGCALNIKWNSAIRSSGLFTGVWIPPFPNDAGSAVGAACCEMMHATSHRALQWDVYSGPGVRDIPVETSGWSHRTCSVTELASLLYESGEPVVMLNGRAELGPRSLGNRSILADARSLAMKQLLNDIKQREDYRPVAPVCLEERAPDLFVPGSPDPLMLYDHQVKEEWLGRIPAVCHVDGSARLQTINQVENAVLYELLTAYEQLSGVPLLCNTSANYKGAGFFPDVDSVIKWGKVNYVWSSNMLYFRLTATLEAPLQEVHQSQLQP